MLKLMLTLIMVAGSDDPPVTLTRAEQLKQLREQKAQNLVKPERTFLENGLIEFKERRILERFQEGIYGFHPVLGGLATGAGFAAGTRFEKDGFHASAQASINGSQKYELGFNAPVFDERFFTDFRATYRNFLEQDFYGSGPDSREEERIEYRLEDIDYTGRFGFNVTKHFRAGVNAGWFESNTGAAELRGLTYLKTGAFAEVDYRDQPGNPRTGGFYSAQWTRHQDRNFGRYGFGQYDIEAQQYLPFFNQRRVIALRAKTTLTHTAPGQLIPFHMQPSLGGSEDLRGFREFRYRDNNMVVLNAEYRWEAFSGLDLALFADAGQVAARPTDIDFSDLKKSYGFGFRFNTAKSVFLRTDFGFSNEGRRIFIKFGHVF
jgi:outer membrane translocation and assembly module TamA